MRFNLRTLLRACCVVAVLASWYALTMRDASRSTGWEHHPYAGPFILIKESHSVVEFLFSAAVAAGILIPAFLWVRDGSRWTMGLAIIAALVALGLSYACALSASV